LQVDHARARAQLAVAALQDAETTHVAHTLALGETKMVLDETSKRVSAAKPNLIKAKEASAAAELAEVGDAHVTLKSGPTSVVSTRYTPGVMSARRLTSGLSVCQVAARTTGATKRVLTAHMARLRASEDETEAEVALAVAKFDHKVYYVVHFTYLTS
jgi:hypothetical protein